MYFITLVTLQHYYINELSILVGFHNYIAPLSIL